MIFQDPYASLNPRWRVADIVAEPIRALKLTANRTEIEHRVASLLEKVRLDPGSLRKFPHEFSGGQRQRIAIARALSSQPEFIVCDEPTSALDVSVQAQVLDLMRSLQDEFKLTYLLISHNLAVVRQMADTVGVLHNGILVEQGPVDEIFDNPRMPYTRMLLDAVPDISKVD
jgi:peptide/nickel transport system ATP-binding protein